jgi:hypothetical protein
MIWDARHILRQLADSSRRRAILSAFWKYGEAQSRATALAQLARALHFREETLRKLPLEKKADLLASRIGVPEFEEVLDMALMHYHTHNVNAMLAAFLDVWGIPHKNGEIEVDDYTPPAAGAVRAAVEQLTQFDRRDVAIYLAAAGLLMGGAWRDATWPVVDDLAPVLN